MMRPLHRLVQFLVPAVVVFCHCRLNLFFQEHRDPAYLYFAIDLPLGAFRVAQLDHTMNAYFCFTIVP